MIYRRALLVIDLGADPRAALAALRRVAPQVEKLVVLAHGTVPDEPTAPAALERLRDAIAGAAAHVDLQLAPDLTGLALAAGASASELIVVGPLARAAASAVRETRRWLVVAVLWAQGPPAEPAPARAAAHLLCVARGARSLASVGIFLRDHTTADDRVTLFALAPPMPLDDLPALLEMGGVSARVELLPTWVRLPRLLDWAGDHAVDILVVTRPPPAPLLGWLARRRLPILLLPPAAPARTSPRQPIEASDLVDDGGPLRGRLEQAAAVGRPAPLADETVAFVSGGRVVATALAHEGEVELPAGIGAVSLGVFRTARAADEDPLAAVERNVAVVRRGPRPLLLFDAAFEDAELSAVRAATSGARAPEAIAVRVRPVQSFELVRARLRAAGLSPARVLDATAVLAEGDPLDVPDEVDPVRLARVGARLRGAGFAIAAVVHRGPHPPATVGFPALRAGDLAAAALVPPPPWPGLPQDGSLAARLEATTGAGPILGNRVELELDNAVARGWLLGAIAGSRRTVHVQAYMVADDELARRVERALAEAGARGVAVRVLVDSLHGLHGSLGAQNPLLVRLSACAGVEVRVSRPVTGVPSIEDLKQRDHRKLAVIDGRVALLGGRNLAHEYYMAFAEVPVTARTPWRQLPWLDAGARVEGPAAAALERVFLDAWTGAGGAPFGIAEPAPAGTVATRVVVHRGLRDAYTLETYLALIDTARAHVDLVNGFPLQLEIQHALVRALRRGVRVRALFGNVLPTYGEGQAFGGSLATARSLATQLVHSRMDAVVAAGGEGYELAVRDVPGWDPELGIVRPHVHAKVMSADGAACAVGSANLDVTAGYWESELLLVVEDPAVTRGLEARLDALFAASLRVDREDPAWQRLAARRAWLRHWPGMIG